MAATAVELGVLAGQDEPPSRPPRLPPNGRGLGDRPPRAVDRRWCLTPERCLTPSGRQKCSVSDTTGVVTDTRGVRVDEQTYTGCSDANGCRSSCHAPAGQRSVLVREWAQVQAL